MLDNDSKNFLSQALTFWDKLTTQEQELILNNTNLMQFHQGDHLHRGDTDCIGVLLIKSGELRVYILSEDGREITLYRLNHGEICVLSASCIIKNITFEVHINAEKDSEVIIINSAAFSKLTQQNILADNFTNKEALNRFSDVMWTMEQILFMSFDKRLAVFLLDELAKKNDKQADTIQLTHEQIAKYIGSAREVVSRMLKYFANEGLVELSRGGVKIINKKGLRQLI